VSCGGAVLVIFEDDMLVAIVCGDCVEAMCFPNAYVVNQITIWLEETDNKAIANSLCYFQFAGENERFRSLSSARLFFLLLTTCQCTASSMVELSG
jgi:hypothetical protein